MRTVDRSSIRSVGAIAVMVSALGGAPAASAASSSPHAEPASLEAIVDSVTAFWTEFGVPAGEQDALVAGIRAGDAPDALTALIPVDARSEEVDGFELIVSTYADGSIAVSRVQQPAVTEPGTTVARGVSGCSSSSSGGSHYRSNCLVDRWDGIVSQSFRADFVFVDSAYDRITSVYSASTTVIGSSSTSQTAFGIVKANENASGPARAELVASAALPWGTHNYGLGLRVGASIGGQSYSWSG